MKSSIAPAVMVLLMLFWPPDGNAADPCPNVRDKTASIDLHAHLFMDEGMSFLFTGDFEDSELSANSYDDALSNQANAQSVNASGNGVIVVSLYGNSLLSYPSFVSPRQQVENQIDLAEKFVKQDPQWIIAKSSTEARTALYSGKRVLVLAIEGADGIIETDEDIRHFVQRGVSQVTLEHLTDDKFGGAAILPGTLDKFANPFSYLGSVLLGRKCDQTYVNGTSLSPRGAELVQKLIDAGVWVDLSHASDATAGQAIGIMERNDVPILDSHTSLREFLGAERGIPKSRLETYKNHRLGAMIGVVPSSKMLQDTPVDDCPKDCDCSGGIQQFVRQVNEFSSILGDSGNVAVGTDTNGAIPHLKPTCGTNTVLDTEGYYHIGQTQALWTAMRNLKAKLPAQNCESIERFIELWEKVEKRKSSR